MYQLYDRTGYLFYTQSKNVPFGDIIYIIAGGSQILTPEGFLDNIKQLSSGASFAEGDDE